MAENTYNKWKWQHTLSLTILSTLTLGITKSIEVFYDFYAKSFSLTSREYRYILISMSCGGFLSIFIGPNMKRKLNNLLNTKYNISYLLIMIYGIFGALACTIYPLPIIPYNFIFIWSLSISFIQGLFLVLIATQIFDYANHCSSPNNKGFVISVLSLSWPLCTLLNVIIGYLLNNNLTRSIFYIFGFAILVQLFLINFVIFPKQLKDKTDIAIASNDNSIRHQIALIIQSRIACSLLLIQLISCIGSGILNTTINGSWLSNIFNLNPFQIGIVSITLFIAEILGSIITGKLLDYGSKHNQMNTRNIWFFAMYFMGVIIKLITAIFMLVFVYLYTENVGSLTIAIIIIFFMYFGWESVIVTQLYAYTYLLNHTDITFETMFNISTSFTYIGRICGIELTTIYWNNGGGLFTLSIFITGLFLFSLLFRIFVYYLVNRQQSVNYNIVSNETDIEMTDNDNTNDDNDNDMNAFV